MAWDDLDEHLTEVFGPSHTEAAARADKIRVSSKFEGSLPSWAANLYSRLQAKKVCKQCRKISDRVFCHIRCTNLFYKIKARKKHGKECKRSSTG